MYSIIRATKLLTVSSFMTMSALNAQQPSFVSGQVLMRFSEGTPQRNSVEQASQSVPLDLSGLDNVIDELSERLGVPLRIHHLGSGYWLTLDVDRNVLTERMRGVLGRQDGVATVTVANQPGRDSVVRLAIAPEAGSGLSRSIERRNERALSQVLEAWSAAAGLALRYTFEDDHLTISVDWNTATVDMVDGLKAMPEVETAQLNYRMGLSSSQERQ